MHIYKGANHIGSKAVFDYEDCLTMYDGLKELSIKLTFRLDKAGYDATQLVKLFSRLKAYKKLGSTKSLIDSLMGLCAQERSRQISYFLYKVMTTFNNS